MNLRELKYNPHTLRYTGIIGTGGIGTGKFFALAGNHTLGREESRSGHFLDVRDYCKQHIILHYVKVLLGPAFPVTLVGRIGDDDIGLVLLREMEQTGFVMKRIDVVPNVSTLFSLCFIYPDGSGGNLTTDDSASAHVDEAFIDAAAADIETLGDKGIIMAAPEVPLKARKKMLELGRRYGSFCSASFTTGEIYQALEEGILANVDFISINVDEASAVAGNFAGRADTGSLVQAAVRRLRMSNDKIIVSVTAGSQGSWCWDGRRMSRFPAVATTPVSTAGAGDAFFAGMLCGIALGLTPAGAQQLATLVAGLSVTSPHTIHSGVDRHSLYEFLGTSGLTFSENIIKLLED